MDMAMRRIQTTSWPCSLVTCILLYHLYAKFFKRLTLCETIKGVLSSSTANFILWGTSSWKVLMHLFYSKFTWLWLYSIPALRHLVVLLFKRLLLEFNNSSKDNNNWFVMAFCSLLTAQRVFNHCWIPNYGPLSHGY